MYLVNQAHCVFKQRNERQNKRVYLFDFCLDLANPDPATTPFPPSITQTRRFYTNNNGIIRWYALCQKLQPCKQFIFFFAFQNSFFCLH